ncbi:hypothetical protein M407DRAFT_24743 [Tulasnella calospora MUT 4182]|uniref:Uncharacterized protein n=1 Tax=Tulasnella calospora MUT 4182 TaxID=1051891 RepID=A0A0C3KWT8_9AGAM|nr:hypothetical protein M407DRAFT_24743 [Tulasnella calospora MUT 4182]
MPPEPLRNASSSRARIYPAHILTDWQYDYNFNPNRDQEHDPYSGKRRQVMITMKIPLRYRF